jgi:hypothetical protein
MVSFQLVLYLGFIERAECMIDFEANLYVIG